MENPPLRDTTTYINDPNEDLPKRPVLEPLSYQVEDSRKRLPKHGMVARALHSLFGWMFKPHEPLTRNITSKRPNVKPVSYKKADEVLDRLKIKHEKIWY